MKLIIDISTELYESYKDRPPMLGDAGMDMIAQSIANGTPFGEVLQEIRQEIEKEKQSRCFNDMFEYITGIDDALAIIDKHIKEIEE